MLVAMLLVVGMLLRSATGALLILVLATLSALVSLGALGWTRIPINSATAVAPLMVITLAVASSVHMLSSVRQTMQETPTARSGRAARIIDHGLGITVAVFTTAIGFLSLNFSISPPFRQLGNMVAGGMIGVWVFTMFLLPGLICWLPMRQNKKRRLGRQFHGRARRVRDPSPEAPSCRHPGGDHRLCRGHLADQARG